MGRREKTAGLILLVIASLSFFLSIKNFYHNHTNAAAAVGGSYTEGVLGQPSYINPLLALNDPDLTLAGLVFSGLYKYNTEGKLVPDLAESLPQISEDQKQYTVNLRHDAKWHNGRPVTADDIIFTIQLLKDPSSKSPLRALWQSTNVEKLSDFSVKFTTKDISGPFIDNLTLGILPQSVWTNLEPQNFLLSKLNLEAVGSGPYSVAEINKLPNGKIQQLTLQANANYYAGMPKIGRIIFKFYDIEEDILNAFHSREIDGFGFTPLGSNLFVNEDQPKVNIITSELPQQQVVFFNLNNKILADQNVRQALTLATDKQQIINEVFKGKAFLPSSPFLFSAEKNETLPAEANLEQANVLLDTAGYKLDPETNLRTKQKVILELTISTNDSSVNAKAAEILANQWKQLNIKVNLSVVPGKQLMDQNIKPRNFDVLLFPQKFGADPDPFLFWHSSQVKDPGYNLTGFKDQETDRLIADSRTTTDKQIRKDNYTKLSELILKKFPVIFLDQTEYIYVLDSKIKNASIGKLYNPSQRFTDVANWYIVEKRVWK